MTKCAAIAETQGHSGPLLGTVITDAGSSRRRMDHQAHRSVCHERCFERLCSHTRCSAVDGCVRRQGRPPRSVFSRANTMTRYARSFCTVANGSTGRRLLFMIRGDTICCALPGTERIEPSNRQCASVGRLWGKSPSRRRRKPHPNCSCGYRCLAAASTK